MAHMCDILNLQTILQQLTENRQTCEQSMSVPESIKRSEHKVVSMGYNSNLLKGLVVFNIVLVVLLGFMLYWNVEHSARSSQAINRLNNRLSQLQLEVHQLSSQAGKGNSHQVPRKKSESLLILELQDEVQALKDWKATASNGIKSLFQQVQMIHEKFQGLATQVVVGQTKMQYMRGILEYLMEYVKALQKMISRLDYPDLSSFKQSFSNFGNKFRKNFEDFQTPDMPDMNSIKDKLKGFMGGLFDSENESSRSKHRKGSDL